MAQPAKAWRSKGVDIAAWPTNNGGISYTFRKSYKDKTSGEYKDTRYFYDSDLKELISLVKQALHWQEHESGMTDTRASGAMTAEDALIKKMIAAPVDDDDIPF